MITDPALELDSVRGQVHRLTALTACIATDLTQLRRVTLESAAAWPVLTAAVERTKVDEAEHASAIEGLGARLWQRELKIRALMVDAETTRGRIEKAQAALAHAAASPLPRFYQGKAAARRWRVGLDAARDALAEALSQPVGLEPRPLSDQALVAASGLFDETFYRRANPDIDPSQTVLVDHYLRCGGPEGRCPGPLFDGALYLSANPDVAAAKLNPLLHFVLYGIIEKRPGGVPLARLPFWPTF